MGPTPRQRQRRWHRLRIALFVAALAAPGVRMLLPDAGPAGLGEKRALATRPALPRSAGELERFPRRFETYFADHFGFRGPLVRAYHRIVGRVLHASSRDVIVGLDGWLFHASATSIHGELSLAEQIHWRQALENRRDWLAERGIPLLVVFTPAKSSIHPEQLPEGLRPRGASRLDQLLAGLSAGSSVPVLDLRPTLRRASQRERVYQRTDSHWEDAGAHAAYAEILTAVAERTGRRIEPTPRAAFAETVSHDGGGNMAQLLGLGDDYREPRRRLTPKVEGDFRPARPEPGRASPWVTRVLRTDQGPAGSPRIVVFGDSFGVQLAPFLAPHFARVDYSSPEAVDVRALVGTRPDLVVNQIAEFHLLKAPKLDSAEVVEHGARARFAAARPRLELGAPEVRRRFEPLRRVAWRDDGPPGRLETRARDALLAAPAFEPPRSGDALVRLVLHAEAETRARLYYGIDGAEGYREARSRARRLSPGENVLTFAIADPRFDGRLALLPGGRPGIYEIRSFEVRETAARDGG